MSKPVRSSDRILFLLTSALAAYQVAIGIDGFNNRAVLWHTIGFGVLLIACLLLIIFGFDILESPWVVAIAAILPISIAAGLVSEYMSEFEKAYLAFGALGVLFILLSRLLFPSKIATIVLAIVHGIAGLLIVILPLWIAAQGKAVAEFALVSLGGVIIGIVGLLLSILKTGKSLLPISSILRLFPALLFLMSACFVAGMALG